MWCNGYHWRLWIFQSEFNSRHCLVQIILNSNLRPPKPGFVSQMHDSTNKNKNCFRYALSCTSMQKLLNNKECDGDLNYLIIVTFKLHFTTLHHNGWNCLKNVISTTLQIISEHHWCSTSHSVYSSNLLRYERFTRFKICDIHCFVRLYYFYSRKPSN